MAREEVSRDDVGRDEVARDEVSRDDVAREEVAREEVVRDEVSREGPEVMRRGVPRSAMLMRDMPRPMVSSEEYPSSESSPPSRIARREDP